MPTAKRSLYCPACSRVESRYINGTPLDEVFCSNKQCDKSEHMIPFRLEGKLEEALGIKEITPNDARTFNYCVMIDLMAKSCFSCAIENDNDHDGYHVWDNYEEETLCGMTAPRSAFGNGEWTNEELTEWTPGQEGNCRECQKIIDSKLQGKA